MLSRRHLLTLTTATAAGLAGCGTDDRVSPESPTDTDAGEDDTRSETDAGPTTSEPGATGTDGPTDAPDDPDLREANVVGVSVEDAGDGEYDVSVTLHHDDDGEDGYANWWQVETLDGEELGRRDLTHAHSRQPFTRSATIAVPADVDCVVVRGHDQTHGYGGRAMVVSVPDGATRSVAQGGEPAEMAGEACP